MRARRAENPEQPATAVSWPDAQGARRRWQRLYRCLRRAQPGPERSGGTRPTPAVQSPAHPRKLEVEPPSAQRKKRPRRSGGAFHITSTSPPEHPSELVASRELDLVV